MKYLKLFEDFKTQDDEDILLMAETKGGRYRIEVYQSEIDKKTNKYSFHEFTNDRSTGTGGGYNKAQMNVWLNFQIEGSAKIDGINYIVKSNKGGFDILPIEKDTPYKSYQHYHRHFGIHPQTGEPFDWSSLPVKEKTNTSTISRKKKGFTQDDYDEVYAEIEMRMRPSDNSLPYSELEEIVLNCLMTEPDEESMIYVNNVMQDYLTKRDKESENELKDSVKDCLSFFKDDDSGRHSTDIENLSFEEFYDWFTKGSWEDDLVKEYTREEIKAEFDKQTKDPNQMSLPLGESIKRYTKEDGTKVTQYKEIKTRKGFKIGDEVEHNGKKYKIHSFSEHDKNRVYLRKYRKDGKLDSRDRGIISDINSIKHYSVKESTINEGKGRCPSCEMMYIQGVRCHERGCPEAWKDEKVECKWCGSEFTPEERGQEFCCEDCAEAYNG